MTTLGLGACGFRVYEPDALEVFLLRPRLFGNCNHVSLMSADLDLVGAEFDDSTFFFAKLQ